jgi:multiple sugar transport system substrate-binding protein
MAKTHAAGITTGCIGQGVSGNDWCLQAILASNGGSVLSQNGQSTTFNSAADISALTTMRGLAADGSMVDLTTAQAVQEFSAGKLAMLINSSALQSTLLTGAGSSFTLKDAALPGFTGHAVAPVNSGSALVVFSKDPAKQKAAWKLIQWLTSPESETTITKDVGYPPLRTSLATSTGYLKPFADAHPLIAVNLGQLGHLVPWQAYPGPNFLQIETLIIDAASKAVFQGANVAQSLQGAQTQAAGLMQS